MCNFIAGFSIDFAYCKLVVKCANDHMTDGCCEGHKCPFIAKCLNCNVTNINKCEDQV